SPRQIAKATALLRAKGTVASEYGPIDAPKRRLRRRSQQICCRNFTNFVNWSGVQVFIAIEAETSLELIVGRGRPTILDAERFSSAAHRRRSATRPAKRVKINRMDYSSRRGRLAPLIVTTLL
ncbi:hypothetical protein, partial [Sinorhizobium meliloti]|uniref:hypothetical protein n=1 Tax=Rhizobium meliloti TaxID=382 RepID=UPI001AECE99D